MLPRNNNFQGGMKMLKRADRSFNNSLGPNVYSDDKTALNYKALAYCIAGCKINNKRRYASVNNICRAFGLFDPNEEKVNLMLKEKLKDEAKEIKRLGLNVRSNKNLKYIVENIKTGEKTECAGLIGVSSLIGITYDNISGYISKGAVYKKTYKIYRVGEASKISNIRAVKITNVKTNEVKKFESLKSAAKFINIAPSSVAYNMKRNQPARGWKVEFID